MTIKRRVLTKAFRLFEVEPIPFWRLDDFPHVSLLRKLIEFKRVDCVVDVGAYDGAFGRLLRDEVGYSGKIVSFEPQPELFQKLERIASRDPKWTVFNYALGSAEGTVTLNVMRGRPLSSVLQPTKNMPSNIAHRNIVEERVDVAIKRLDAVFPQMERTLDIKAPFLKIDTQGYDLEVFRGAVGCIDKFVMMQSEVSVIQLYEGSPRWQEAIAEYSANGLGLSGLFPVSFDEELRVIEFDAVFVRPQRT